MRTLTIDSIRALEPGKIYAIRVVEDTHEALANVANFLLKTGKKFDLKFLIFDSRMGFIDVPIGKT